MPTKFFVRHIHVWNEIEKKRLKEKDTQHKGRYSGLVAFQLKGLESWLYFRTDTRMHNVAFSEQETTVKLLLVRF